MTDLGYSKLRPLYEAMSVCAATAEWLQQQEQEQVASDLVFHLSTVSHSLKEVIGALSGKDPWPEDVSEDDLRTGSLCMTMLGSMVMLLTGCVRGYLPGFPIKIREQGQFLLDEIENHADRLTDIVEAWDIPFDRDLSGKIDHAIGQLDPTKKDIGDWRKTLEALSD